MKVSGFTFVRNAVKFEYPVVESITSILPLCDEFVIALGNSEDTTDELVLSIDSPKIKIVRTTWDDTLRKGGEVFAKETEKAFRAISKDSDWAFYIQADEVLHEEFYPVIQKAMHTHRNNPRVEGLLFNYKHFYGSYSYIGDSYGWYRREVRIIRNDKNIISYRDAQGFRKFPKRRLRVKPIDAYIYHYGWVRHPKAMQNKQTSNSYFNFNDEWIEKNMPKKIEFDYSQITSLQPFKDTHPGVMKDRIKTKNWKFNHDISNNFYSFKDKIKAYIEKKTGWRIGEFRNYRII